MYVLISAFLIEPRDGISVPAFGNHIINWGKYFSSIEKAKAYAERRHGASIEWSEHKGFMRSPDFGMQTFFISEIKVEE